MNKKHQTQNLAFALRLVGTILLIITAILALTMINYSFFAEGTVLGRFIRGSVFDPLGTWITMIIDGIGGVFLWWIARNPLAYRGILDAFIALFFVHAVNVAVTTHWLVGNSYDLVRAFVILLLSCLLGTWLLWFRPRSR